MKRYRSVAVGSCLVFLVACAAADHAAHHGGASEGHHGYSDSHHRTEGSLASDIPLDWYPLREGTTLAAQQGKPIIVEFYAPESCSRCDKMAKYVWSNPEIMEAVARDFVLVRLDLTRRLAKDEIALGRKYDYNYDCLLIFLDHRGEVIEDVSGNRMCFADAVDPEWFLSYLDRAKAQGARQ